MTITRQHSGKLRKDDSIPAIGKGVLSTPKRLDRLYGPLSRLLRGKRSHLVAVQRPGVDAVVCCPV